jgi:hypothetical protein
LSAPRAPASVLDTTFDGRIQRTAIHAGLPAGYDSPYAWGCTP